MEQQSLLTAEQGSKPFPEIEWCLRRRHSLSPRGFGLVLGSLAALSFGIGFFFAQMGVWLVMPFVGIECLALLVAYVVWGRHAADYDRVCLQGHEVLVERYVAGVQTTESLPRSWVRVTDPKFGLGGVRLQAGPKIVEVGRVAPLEERDRFAQEFRQALRMQRFAV